jgi:hypothetical protein
MTWNGNAEQTRHTEFKQEFEPLTQPHSVSIEITVDQAIGHG